MTADPNRETQEMPIQNTNGVVKLSAIRGWFPLVLTIVVLGGNFIYEKAVQAQCVETNTKSIKRLEQIHTEAVKNLKSDYTTQVNKLNNDVENLRTDMAKIRDVSNRNNTILELIGQQWLGSLYPEKRGG